MIKRVPIYLLRVVYKSGFFHDFEVTRFKMTGNIAEWDSADKHNKPLSLGLDEIAAVWQIGVRNSWRFKNS